ncbi:MAG: PAS domain S-box protein, partial [Desulfomonile tiedjei]|nr:PAS domain S-box protein [Desulfomonile tiedjei]
MFKYSMRSLTSTAAEYVTPVAAGLVVLLGMAVLVEWTFDRLWIARIKEGFVPVAPATALCFTLLGTCLLLRQRGSRQRILQICLRIATGFTLLFCIALFAQSALLLLGGESLDIERWIAKESVASGGFVIARMSPLTAVIFALISLAILYSFPSSIDRGSSDLVTSVLAVVSLTLGAVLAIGYWYGTPFLYGGPLIPVALPTAIGFILLSFALLFDGPDSLFYRISLGDSVFARFTRTAVPGCIAVILIGGWFTVSVMSSAEASYRVISVSVTALLTAFLAAFLMSISARNVQAVVTRAEESMRESERRYRDLYEKTPALIQSIDRSGRLVGVSDYWLEFLGYERHEVIGRSPIDFQTEESRRYALSLAIPNFLETGLSKNEPLQFVKKSGEVVDVLLTATAERDAEGTIIRSRAILNDITSRKQAEKLIHARIAQQAAVADLGRIALAGEDLSALMDQTVEKVARALECEYSKILELLPNGREFLLRAGLGWRAGLVGTAKVGAGTESQAGYTLQAHDPVIVENLPTESRFSGPPLLHEHEIVSGISVLISGEHGPFGVMGVHSSKTRKFTKEDVNVCQAVANVLAQAIERKRAEEALRESEERYRMVVALSPDGIALHLHGRFIFANPAAVNLLGAASSEELIGRPIMEVVHPDYAVIVRNRLEDLRKGEPQPPLEQKLIRIDGRTIDVELAAVPLFHGGEVAVQVTFRDISARKKAQEDQRRLATAVEQAAEAVVITDRNGRIEYVNPAMEHVSGYTKEELLGDTFGIFGTLQNSSEFREDLWNTLVSGKTWNGRLTNKKKNGGIYYEDATISPVRDTRGEIINFVAVKRDITEHLELSKQLLQAQKMEAVGTLAGGIAHDFNNLLQVAIGYSELLMSERRQSDPEYNDLKKILHAARSGAELVQRLLTFSRKVEPKTIPLNLNRQIHQVEKFLRRTIPRMIEIELNLSDGLAEADADPTQIEQVLMNLAVNARDAMPEGGKLTIETRNISLDNDFCNAHVGITPGDYVALVVEDTGHGIA